MSAIWHGEDGRVAEGSRRAVSSGSARGRDHRVEGLEGQLQLLGEVQRDGLCRTLGPEEMLVLGGKGDKHDSDVAK